MRHEFREEPGKGRCLFLTDGKTEIGLALDYGIRVLHLSCSGMENLFYSQPADGSDGLTTEEGWRIYGGHRLWTSPESAQTYYPDNAPVDCRLIENGAELLQKPDPWLQLRKKLRICFEENGSILLQQSYENTGSLPVSIGPWGVNTLAGGGHAEVWFDGGIRGCCTPQRHISLWGDTGLGDSRLRITKDRIYGTHAPSDDYLKLGIFSKTGKAVFENKGQRMELTFGADPEAEYPDGGCNFEMFMNRYIMELETLGPMVTLAPGESVVHEERWHLSVL